MAIKRKEVEMKDSLKREIEINEMSAENSTECIQSMLPERSRFFDQVILNDKFSNNPRLRKIYFHWSLDFSGSVFGLLIWLTLMTKLFGVVSLLAFVIPLSGVAVVLLSYVICGAMVK